MKVSAAAALKLDRCVLVDTSALSADDFFGCTSHLCRWRGATANIMLNEGE